MADGALQAQAAALEEGAGFHRQLLVGDVAVDVAGAVEPHLLGGDRAGHLAAHFDGLGVDAAFDRAAVADGDVLDADVALDGAFDLDLAAAGDVALERSCRRR